MVTSKNSQVSVTEHAYIEALRQEFPKLRLIDKRDSPLSRLIDVALRVVTLGSQSQYMSSYVTTLGQRIYLPDGWRERSERSRVVTLRHEAVHLRQFRRFGWLGMSLLYVLPILPIGLAVGRAYLEWQAYRETILASAELFGFEYVKTPAFEEHLVRQFCSGAYGWMWPFPGAIRRRIREVIAQIETVAAH